MLGGAMKLLTPTESEIVVADPFTGEVKKRVRAPYPNLGKRSGGQRQSFYMPVISGKCVCVARLASLNEQGIQVTLHG
jgi:hypothetical protein